MVPHVLQCVRAIQPQSILDIGIGYGKYGLLVREYLEVPAPSTGNQAEKLPLRVDGVEAFPEYVGPIQRAIYDNVFVGDARQVVPTLGHYDLALMLDVIEHLSHADGQALLTELLERTSKGIVLTTPVEPKEQGAILGNEYERHVSKWRPHNFQVSGGVVQWMILERVLLVYVHKPDAPDVQWLHPLRLRRRLNLAIRQCINVLLPGSCNCPRI